MNSHPVLLVLAIAVLAPLLAEIPVGFRLPALVLEMVLGIVVGPHVLGWATDEGLLGWLGGTLGLAALFLMAGMELDLERVRGRPLSLATRGWFLSLVLAVAAAGLLHGLPFVHAPLMIALALPTTALGVVLPILRDEHEMESAFGRMVLAAGAAGEFLPVIVMSLVLTGTHSGWIEIGLMLGFVAIALAAALVALSTHPPRLVALLGRTLESSSQLPVRIAVLLVTAFVVLSESLGFEVVPGAFAAGMVVGLATRGPEGRPLRAKVEAVCFGFLVPFFFVASGIRFDLKALLNGATPLLLVPVFLALLLLIRGVPVLLYRSDLAKNERLPFALYSATTLPIVVAIAEIGVRTKRLGTDMSAALVGAAMLSVLVFPALAGKLRSRACAAHKSVSA